MTRHRPPMDTTGRVLLALCVACFATTGINELGALWWRIGEPRPDFSAYGLLFGVAYTVYQLSRRWAADRQARERPPANRP